MKADFRTWLVYGFLALAVGGDFSLRAEGAPEAPAGNDSPYVELSRMDTLSEVTRYLYRWYLDEEDFDGIAGAKTLTFHIRPTHPKLDEGDHSLYAEVLIPHLGTVVLLKKTDYTIDELELTVRSGRFKIVNVEKVEGLSLEPAPLATVEFPVREMLDYLFRTRAQPDVPSPDLLDRLRTAVRAEAGDYAEQHTGDRTVFFAPLSPVANEVWCFWEEAKLLLRWASDVDLDNPAVWKHESLAVKIYDIEQQTVATFSEAPGSNAYLIRDQVGRVLYNCVVLGRKFVIPPPVEK